MDVRGPDRRWSRAGALLAPLLVLVLTLVPASPAGAARVAGRGIAASVPAQVTAGARITVTGTVSTRPAGSHRRARVVRLQERVHGRWRTRAHGRSTSAGTFRLRLAAGTTARTRVLRVLAPRTGRLGARTTGSVRVRVADAGSTHFAVRRDERSGAVVRWATCQPIPYLLDPAGSPAGWSTVVARVMAKVSAATGYSFAYRGTTSRRPDEVDGAIVVEWSDAAHNPHLAGSTAGVGSTRWTTGADQAPFYVSGGVSLDRTLLTAPARTRSRVIEEILLHEMGHVMGLLHVGDRHQVMYPTASGDLLAYQAGDRNGLRMVGRGAGPCRTAATARGALRTADVSR